MPSDLNGKRIAILVDNEGVEQVELVEPRKAIEAAGAETELIAPEAGRIQAVDHLDKADKFEVDRAVGDADAAVYDGLLLPGGVANPDNLRTDAARSASFAPSSRRASRWRRSVTRPGCWWRPTSSRDGP